MSSLWSHLIPRGWSGRKVVSWSLRSLLEGYGQERARTPLRQNPQKQAKKATTTLETSVAFFRSRVFHIQSAINTDTRSELRVHLLWLLGHPRLPVVRRYRLYTDTHNSSSAPTPWECCGKLHVYSCSSTAANDTAGLSNHYLLCRKTQLAKREIRKIKSFQRYNDFSFVRHIR